MIKFIMIEQPLPTQCHGVAATKARSAVAGLRNLCNVLPWYADSCND